MTHPGLRLTKLKALGKNQDPAEIEFREGLNLISGASDTGKSYIFECIRYMLGGTEPPKDVDEGADYTTLYMECKPFDGNAFTLKRSLKGGEFLMYHALLSNIDETTPGQGLKSKGSGDSVSTLLLNASGFEGRKVKTNSENKTRDLSFRDLRNLVAIDEEKIISAASPVLSGQVIHKTVERSVFDLVTSGIDSSSLIASPNSKTEKATSAGRVEVYDELIANLEKRLGKNPLSTSDSEEEINKIETGISQALETMSEVSAILKEQMEARQLTWDMLDKLKGRLTTVQELSKRFSLLDKHYDADLKRLEFIREGNFLLSQMKQVDCPYCGQVMQVHKPSTGCKDDSVDGDTVETACAAEIDKIRIHTKDLGKTLNQFEEESRELEKQLVERRFEYTTVENKIKSVLQPQLLADKKKIDELITKKEAASERQMLQDQLRDLMIARKKIGTKSKVESGKSEGKKLDAMGLHVLSDEISKILTAWKFPNPEKVTFDAETMDIVISGKRRGSFGKGYRAIAYSAFVLGLMRYCVSNKLPHPGFIVLDSPLTTHRDADSASATDEEVPTSVQDAFFNDLLKSSVQEQIIILENKEPKVEQRPKMNYIHFSGNKAHGRYGFFPMS